MFGIQLLIYSLMVVVKVIVDGWWMGGGCVGRLFDGKSVPHAITKHSIVSPVTTPVTTALKA